MEVYTFTPGKFNLGWLNTHMEVYITKSCPRMPTASFQLISIFPPRFCEIQAM